MPDAVRQVGADRGHDARAQAPRGQPWYGLVPAMINDDSMSLEIDGRVIATAEFSEHAAANGHGAWIVSCHPGRLFTRNQAITAMMLAERLAAGYGDDDPVRGRLARGAGPVTDRLIRITTALAVVAVAVVAAIISYQHAYELAHSHGESGVTARLLPFTVDGLIWAASMVVLDASRALSQVRGSPADSVRPGQTVRS
jgi:Protein of unknown function (DUF2637)